MAWCEYGQMTELAGMPCLIRFGKQTQYVPDEAETKQNKNEKPLVAPTSSQEFSFRVLRMLIEAAADGYQGTELPAARERRPFSFHDGQGKSRVHWE
jgi:hypothetical protein